MRDFFIYKLSSNWPLEVFLEPLNHEKHLCNKIDQIDLYLRNKNRSFLERRYSQQKCQQSWEFFKEASREASVSQLRYLQSVYKQYKTKKLTQRQSQGQSNGEPSKKIMANSKHISENFLGGQWLSMFLFSDLNSKLWWDFDVNWLN